jgi:hypothetical protein
VGPRASLDVRKISAPLGFDPRTVQPIVSRYTDRAILARLSCTVLHIHKNASACNLIKTNILFTYVECTQNVQWQNISILE